MRNFFKDIFIPSGEKTKVVAYNSWIVRWKSFNMGWEGGYITMQDESEIFPSEQDANSFAKQLRESMKLLKCNSIVLKFVTVECNQNKLSTQKV